MPQECYLHGRKRTDENEVRKQPPPEMMLQKEEIDADNRENHHENVGNDRAAILRAAITQ
ncbi:MAG: hypothetical protein ACYCWN_04180 [Ferrimicrobium sp.]|jgi:hypothetical protein|uniref:Uncharacterized protein n=1 Tax=Ferrimicrobium acidiphilum TaxID=121039 RepID=A0ABV3Y8A4_9ACTN|nr:MULTISPECIES: hypothetical protein [Ferrimicrobium]